MGSRVIRRRERLFRRTGTPPERPLCEHGILRFDSFETSFGRGFGINQFEKQTPPRTERVRSDHSMPTGELASLLWLDSLDAPAPADVRQRMLQRPLAPTK